MGSVFRVSSLVRLRSGLGSPAKQFLHPSGPSISASTVVRRHGRGRHGKRYSRLRKRAAIIEQRKAVLGASWSPVRAEVLGDGEERCQHYVLANLNAGAVYGTERNGPETSIKWA